MQDAERPEPHPRKHAVTEGPGPHTARQATTETPGPKSQKAHELPKSPIELKRYIRPEKGDARSRKHAIKKRCTIHHANRKMGGGWHRCLYKTHFVFHRPDLRKIGDDCSIKKWTPACASVQNQIFALRAPVSASRITSASGKGNSAALPRRNSRRHGKLPDP